MNVTWTAWMLALLLGLRHASEPDHVIAVSTLLAEQPRARRGYVLGALWGVGHSLALLIVGGLLLALHRVMSVRMADVFELFVAMMLLLLGARSIVRAVRGFNEGATRRHRHEAMEHEHAGAPDHIHLGGWTLAVRPLLVGLVHGTAGSGALTAVALAAMPSLATGLIYMLIFGLGSIAGMALLTGVAGWPMRRLAERRGIRSALGAAAGIGSMSLGVFWGWPLVVQFAGR